jgi:hypothetical protein
MTTDAIIICTDYRAVDCVSCSRCSGLYMTLTPRITRPPNVIIHGINLPTSWNATTVIDGSANLGVNIS